MCANNTKTYNAFSIVCKKSCYIWKREARFDIGLSENTLSKLWPGKIHSIFGNKFDFETPVTDTCKALSRVHSITHTSERSIGSQTHLDTNSFDSQARTLHTDKYTRY